MYGLPKSEINSAMERGYSAEALERARQFLVRAYYRAYFAWYCEDKENAGAITKEEFYIDGHCLDWQAIVFNDVYMERDGALLQQKVDDNNTEVVLECGRFLLFGHPGKGRFGPIGNPAEQGCLGQTHAPKTCTDGTGIRGIRAGTGWW